MPLPLTKFSPSDPFTSANGWKMAIPFNSLNALAIINNQSNTEFDVFTDYGDYLGTVPAGVLFLPILIGYSTLFLEFRAGSVVDSTNTPTNYVNGMIYSSNEKLPNLQPVALARSVNVGNNITMSTTNILQGTAQQLGVTTKDVIGAPSAAGLIPANIASTISGTQIVIAAIDGSGNIVLATSLEISDVLAKFLGALEIDGTLTLLGKINEIAGMATDGVLGVPGVVKIPNLVTITTTAAQNIISITPPSDGWYRAALGFVLNNSVSGNAITAQATYQDAIGINRGVNFTLINGSTFLVASGTNSFVNGGWACQPLTFYAKAAANITLIFRDPTNVPNDTVFAVLERLG